MQRLCQLFPNASRSFSHGAAFAQCRSFSTTPRRLQALSDTSKSAQKSGLVVDALLRSGLKEIKAKKAQAAAQTVEELWASRSAMTLNSLSPPKDAYAGRSVHVGYKNGNGLADALRKLDSILARNRVRQELRLTERHEKKGVKRRRLQSERWRKHFAAEVRKKVALVLKIKNRGA